MPAALAVNSCCRLLHKHTHDGTQKGLTTNKQDNRSAVYHLRYCWLSDHSVGIPLIGHG